MQTFVAAKDLCGQNLIFGLLKWTNWFCEPIKAGSFFVSMQISSFQFPISSEISHSSDQTLSVYCFIECVKVKYLMLYNKCLRFREMLHKISVSSVWIPSSMTSMSHSFLDSLNPSWMSNIFPQKMLFKSVPFCPPWKEQKTSGSLENLSLDNFISFSSW